MQATAWHSGGNTYGIRVGKPNRDEYFDPKWKGIQVEIEGHFYPFALTEGFWHRCPEFRDRGDPIIRKWLQRRRLLSWALGHPPKLKLVSLGQGRFRLLS